MSRPGGRSTGGGGITPPQPYREPDLSYTYERQCYGQPYDGQGGTEFGWGAGLVAPMYNGNPPGCGDEYGAAAAGMGGGQYQPRCP